MAIGFEIKRKGKSGLEIILHKHTTAPELLDKMGQYSKENQFCLELRLDSQNKNIILGGEQEKEAKTTGIYFTANVKNDGVVFSCNKHNDTKKYLAGFCLDY